MADHSVSPWPGYTLNESVPWWKRWDLPRRDARSEFNRSMQAKEHRIELLTRQLRKDGIDFDGSDDAVQEANDWFVKVMAPIPGSQVLDELSLSITEDMALLLGDVMIDRHPELRWDFFIWGKTNINYQSHVIMGFSAEDPKWHGNLGLARIVHGYGTQIVTNRSGEPAYVDVPQGHVLHGVLDSVAPTDPSRFLFLLSAVDDRCTIT